MSAIPDPVCPNGFPEALLSALAARELVPEEEISTRDHLRACAPCVRLYFDHVILRADLERLCLMSLIETPQSVAPLARRGVIHWLRRVPLAAGILIAVCGIAAGAGVWLLRPIVGAPAGMAIGRVGELMERTSLDFEGAGLGPEANVLEWCSYVASTEQLGTAIVTRVDATGRLDVHGFGPVGRAEWSASDWNDFDDVLPHGIRCTRLLSVVTNRDGDRMREAICVVLEGWYKSGVLIIDPRSGARRGLFLHKGPLAAGNRAGEAVASIPRDGVAERRLLVYGQHGYGTRRRPCVSVLDPDGTPVQHVVLPTIGIAGTLGPLTTECAVEWAPERRIARFRTSETLMVDIPISDGQLDVARATVGLADDLQRSFDRARGEYGAFEAWIDEQGGEPALTERLAEQVVDEPVERINTWRGR